MWCVSMPRDHRWGVPPAHQPPARSAAAHPCGDRQPGQVTGWPLVGARCPHHEAGSAHPVGVVSRRVAGRVDPPPRSGVAGPVNGIAEIDGIDPEVLAEFSQRTREVQQRLDAKLNRFRTDLDREPTPRERWRLEREAVSTVAPPKTTRPHRRPASRRVAPQARHPRCGTPTSSPRHRGSHRRPTGSTSDDDGVMVDGALESLGERQSTWRPAELVRELAAQVPTTSRSTPDQLVGFLQRPRRPHRRRPAVSTCPRRSPPVLAVRRDGRPITEPATDRVLTTQAILDQEEHSWSGRTQRRLAASAIACRHDLDVPRVEWGAGRRVCGGGGDGDRWS
jgi:hypothetical protein